MVAGTVTRTIGAGTETIQVETDAAVIDWALSSPVPPFVFLPLNNVATFQNGPNNSNFVVLNRINAPFPIAFDGTVISRLQQIGGGAAPGGTVLFSNPGGIIISSTAVFDVGNLILTSLTVVGQESGGQIFTPVSDDGGFAFINGASNPNSAIVIESNAQITATTENSFLALVAPRIDMAGLVRVNGSTAYIAGEQLSFRVNQGLFDIVFDVGSDNSLPIVHSGSTGGPASTGGADNHAIYMVAVPKNQAISNLLGGTAGFDSAVSATVENGVIVLSAGFDVAEGEVDRYGSVNGLPAPGIDASFEIRGGTYTSDLFGFAATDMLASATASQPLDFNQDVNLFAGTRAELFANEGATVTVGGNVLVSAARFDSADAAELNLTGGSARIFSLPGGSLQIFGDALVDASATGQFATGVGAGNGTGGTAEVSATDGGMVQIDGGLQLLAAGRGATDTGGASTPDGGAGTGGNVLLAVNLGGTVSVGENLDIDVSGTASAATGAAGTNGESGLGGNAAIIASDGEISVDGATQINAGGRGSNVAGGATLAGGLGQGGTIEILANVGTINFLGDASLNADGIGGNGSAGTAAAGGAGGDGTGGTILIRTGPEVPGGAVGGGATFADLLLSATALGGNGGSGAPTGGAGGDGSGGQIEISAVDEPITFANAALDTDATGGSGGGVVGSPNARGAPGLGLGGTLLFGASGADGTLTGADVTGLASGIGPAGSGNSAGRWEIAVDGSGMEFASIQLDAGATGTVVGAQLSRIDLIDGTLAIAGEGAFFSNGETQVNAAGSGILTGGSVSFRGGSFVTTHSGRADGDATIDVASLLIDVGGSVLAEEGTTLRASEDIQITANDLAMIGDLVEAPDILVRSRDIEILASGFLGGPDTDEVVLEVIAGDPADGPTVIGGDADEAGYTLTDAEFDRIAADRLVIDAPQLGSAPDSPPDVLVRALSIAGLGTASGRIGTFELITPGSARVVGEVTFANARPNDRLVIRGDDRIEILTPEGSIEMTDSTGALGGLLQLFSANIVATNPDLAAQLAENPTFDGRTEALRTNTGAVNLEGYLRAGGVGLFSSGTVFVQNTGTATDFAGITVGGGGLIIGRFQPGTPGGAAAANGAGGFSFVGQLITADQVLLFQFTLDADATVTLVTYSYAGGTNNAGQTIPQGGFDPILALFNAAGTLIDDNDDGGSNVPADSVTGSRFDTFLQVPLTAGDYTVAVSVYPNFANGPTLADGFEGATSFTDVNGNPRTPNFAFDVLGADSATGPGAVGDLDVVAFGRRINADGSVTGNQDFFPEVDFQFDQGVTYTDVAEFNTCLINTGCPGAPPPGEPEFEGNPLTSDEIEGAVDSDETGLLQSAQNNQLVDTSFASEELIEEPVTSGGDSGLWGEGDCDADNDGDCDEVQ